MIIRSRSIRVKGKDLSGCGSAGPDHATDRGRRLAKVCSGEKCPTEFNLLKLNCNDTSFERIRNVSLSFSGFGEIGQGSYRIQKRDRDETVASPGPVGWMIRNPSTQPASARHGPAPAQSFPKNCLQALAEMKDDSPRTWFAVAPGQ
jgi:hypothetical protein